MPNAECLHGEIVTKIKRSTWEVVIDEHLIDLIRDQKEDLVIDQGQCLATTDQCMYAGGRCTGKVMTRNPIESAGETNQVIVQLVTNDNWLSKRLTEG